MAARDDAHDAVADDEEEDGCKKAGHRYSDLI